MHTEMLTDSMVDLAERGVINNRAKNFHHGKAVIGGLCIGSKATYDFIDRNPTVTFAPVYYVNNRQNIARNDNFISINNALSVDLTGQVASESIGFSMYSGTGGQADFVRGATQSKGGKSFIALKSTFKDKNGGLHSRIVSTFAPGTAVTSVRADVMYIVTEFGIAYLWQKNHVPTCAGLNLRGSSRLPGTVGTRGRAVRVVVGFSIEALKYGID